MTGLRPDSTRVWHLGDKFREINPGTVTMPQYFKKFGYHTVSIGKIFHNYMPDSVSWDEPDLRPEQKPQPAPVYKPAPAVVAVADPAPVSTIKVMEIQRAPQYDPGASLRGFSSPTATPSDIGPVQYKPLSSLSGNVKTAYEETSGWMSGFINKFMGVAGTTDRKANLVIFAAAIMLLLLLLALARPHREDYN